MSLFDAFKLRVLGARSAASTDSRQKGFNPGRMLFCGAAAALLAAAQAHAAETTVQVLPSTQTTQPSGNFFQYEINYTCSPGTTGDAACENMKITIPLGAPVGNPPGTTVANWPRQLLSMPPGATSEMQGTNLVITMPSPMPADGNSRTFALRIIPTRYVTPDGTTWPIQAKVAGSNFAPKDSNTVDSTATAQNAITTLKNSSSRVVMVGNEVTYYLYAYCNTNSTLDLEHFRLSDTLSEYFTLVSTSPAYSSYDLNTREIVWDTSDGAPFPQSCSRSNTNSSVYYAVTVRANHPNDNPPNGPVAPNGTEVRNTATYTRTPIQQAETSNQRSTTLNIYQDPPPAGNITNKTGTAALSYSPARTYAGKWLDKEIQVLARNDDAEATFTPAISRNLPEGYTSELIDSLPCLENRTVNAAGNHAIYTPNNIPNATSNPLDYLCQQPAAHPYRINVSPRYYSADHDKGPRAAYEQGWRPEAILVDGSIVQLEMEQEGTADSSIIGFRVPDTARGRVAMVRLPHSRLITNVSMAMATYVDESLNNEISQQGPIFDGEVMNYSFGRAYWEDETTPRAQGRDQARVFVVPPEVQVGASKSMINSTNARSHVEVYLRMDVASPQPITDDLVMADLLPEGLTWMNYGPTTGVRIRNSVSGGTFDKTVQLPIEIIQNYQGSGRSLLRVMIPPTDPNTNEPMFPTTGRYVISLAHDNPSPGGMNISPGYTGAEYVDPNKPGTYNNEVHTYSLSPNASPSSCAEIVGASNQFQPEDPSNLSGGGTDTPGCQDSASLVRAGSGAAAFGTYKIVQGNLDTFSGAAGHTTIPDGTATWTLRWVNEGGTRLRNVVMYEILPYVGDHDVMDNNEARNSAFDNHFIKMFEPLPANVQVQYSASSNPCRPEVYDAPGCVNDWAATPDAVGGAGEVQALRITSTPGVDYASGTEIAVSFQSRADDALRDEVSYNSVAARASLVTDAAMLPAESQRVSLRGMGKTKFRYGKSVDKTEANAGDTLLYTIDVENLGPGDVVNIEVRDVLPDGVRFVSASDEGRHSGIASGGEVEWHIGLNAGEKKSLQVTVTVDPEVAQPTRLTNQAKVAPPPPPEGFDPPDVVNPCEAPDGQDSCAATHVPARPELTLAKSVADASGDGQAQPGEQLTYTVRVTNTGNVDAGGVDITDDPDENTRFVSASHGGVQGTGGADLVNWKNLTVPASGTLELTAVFTVNDPLPAGATRLINVATETGKTPPDCTASPRPGNCAEIPVGRSEPPSVQPVPSNQPWVLVLMALALLAIAHRTYFSRRG